MSDYFADNCRALGEHCDRSIFNYCCGEMSCEITGFFEGKCAKCLPERHFCMYNAECCSGECPWYFFCK